MTSESGMYQRRTPTTIGQWERGRVVVDSKDKRKYERFSKFSKELLMRQWCYLFSNFLEEWTSKELWILSLRYYLEERLKRVWIDSYNLKAKSICYGWKEGGLLQSGEERVKQRDAFEMEGYFNIAIVPLGGYENNETEEYSFVSNISNFLCKSVDVFGEEDIGVERVKAEGKSKRASEEVSRTDTMLELDIDEKEYEWLQACAVGYVNSEAGILSLQDAFEMEGYFNIAIVPLGEERWRTDPLWWLWGYENNEAEEYSFVSNISNFFCKSVDVFGEEDVGVEGFKVDKGLVCPSEEFRMEKRLRQRDLMSPFLFIVVAQGLHYLISKAVYEGMFEGVPVSLGNLCITHLQVADDTVIMGKARMEYIWATKEKEFLWGMSEEGGRKICWVKWEWVCLEKEKGGLGVLSVKKKNLALLGKWWATFEDNSMGLWKKVLVEKYYGGEKKAGVGNIRRRRLSKVLEDIVSIGGENNEMSELVRNGFKWEVGDENSIKFWQDNWVEERCTGAEFPRLKNLARNKDIKISEMGCWSEGVWRWRNDWRRTLFGRECEDERLLREMLEGVRMKEGIRDRRVWKDENSGEYIVKKAYSLLDLEQRVLEKDFCKAIWNNLLPRKVSFFAWRFFLGRLPTKLNLERRGFQLERGINSYGKCREEVEDEGHVMLSCRFAYQVWMKCFNWWGYVVVLPKTIEEAYRQVALGFFNSKIQKVWSFVCVVISWSL
ncbi:hypothetical protein SLEP1_g34176 [Rubroshorea leprosula]|uniref:Reverse transcriptase zinc-binding domain-containing protein n=1 Tax=Rubroshorea leprosula TaxID=152421 RepID=A0AAV5KJ18_9ROSI|nr:hypothetical protein SLEP1_g34176 [Rubroshorea leprosula]